MSAYKIQEATAQDLILVHDLATRIWQKTYESIISQEQIDYMFELMYSLEGLSDQLQNKHHAFFILYEGEIALGFASISFAPEKLCKLHKLYLLPEMQGKKLGTYFIDFVAGYAVKKGAEILSLNVNRYNEKAFAFYQKNGFYIYETVDIPLDKFVLNDYVMHKHIAAHTAKEI